MLRLSRKTLFAIEAVLDIAYHAGAQPVHCDNDDATLDEVFRILALRAGYAGRVVLRRVVRAPSERLVESIGISSLGWRPDVPIRQRVLDLDAAWLRENVTAI